MTQSRTAETDVGVRELHDQLSRYVRPPRDNALNAAAPATGQLLVNNSD